MSQISQPTVNLSTQMPLEHVSLSAADDETENFHKELSNINVDHVVNADDDLQLDPSVILNAGALAKALVLKGKLADTYKKIAKWSSFNNSQKKRFIAVWKALDGIFTPSRRIASANMSPYFTRRRKAAPP